MLRMDDFEQAECELLKDAKAWNTVDIDYERPRVERLWRPWRDFRLNLHCLHHCKPGEALFHPHPWPSIMRVIWGKYEMDVGFGSGDTPPPVAMQLVLGINSVYSMLHPDTWHSVRPLNEDGTRYVFSFMLTGQPWDRTSPKPGKKTVLQGLSDHRRGVMLELFKHYYKLPERFTRTFHDDGRPALRKP